MIKNIDHRIFSHLWDEELISFHSICTILSQTISKLTYFIIKVHYHLISSYHTTILSTSLLIIIATLLGDLFDVANTILGSFSIGLTITSKKLFNSFKLGLVPNASNGVQISSRQLHSGPHAGFARFQELERWKGD